MATLLSREVKNPLLLLYQCCERMAKNSGPEFEEKSFYTRSSQQFSGKM
jgi:hypothetical protein